MSDTEKKKRPPWEDRVCDDCDHSYSNHNHTKNAYDFVDNSCKECRCSKYNDEWVQQKFIIYIQD